MNTRPGGSRSGFTDSFLGQPTPLLWSARSIPLLLILFAFLVGCNAALGWCHDEPATNPAANSGAEANSGMAANPVTSDAQLNPHLSSPDKSQLTNAGDHAWMMMSSALILFMTAPGLALFYAGLVRKKNVLSVFMQCMFLTCAMAIAWCVYGYSLTYSHGGAMHPWIGGWDHLFLWGVTREWNEAMHQVRTPMWHSPRDGASISMLSHMLFQGMFFSISPAIICGAFAERIKFHAMVVFSILWGTFVYCPIAHWIWAGGILSYPSGVAGGAIDFAGGAVVHISSGVSALVAAIVIGPRLGFGKDPMPPHNLTYTAMGAAMLWFGWFGFNSGSAFAANEIAVSAFVTTHLAAAAGAMGWWFVEWQSRGKPTLLGVSSGLVAGLVSITPAAGYVQPMAAIGIGLAAGIVCYYSCSWCKNWARYDDSLDAFGIHGVGGILGAVLTGIFATRACNDVGHGRKLGLIEGGDILMGQFVSIGIIAIYSGLMSLVLLKVIDWTLGLRVSASDERQGLDVQQHGEEGYIFL
jgi:Amt family ammonium transporter